MTTDLPLELPDAAEVAGLRLVATDMDGTLLDGEHRLDPRFWYLVDRFQERGVEVCAATGRQVTALGRLLGERMAALTVIADNGATLVRHGRVERVLTVDDAVIVEVVRRVRELAERGERVAVSVADTELAVIEGADPGAIAEARVYYPNARVVPDVTAVPLTAVKASVFSVGPAAEVVVPLLADLRESYAVQQGHEHWVDVNAAGTDKGAALRELQASLGIGPEHTAAFGDHLNDLGLLGAASMSFAMANARPEVLAAARFRAPANTAGGVVSTLHAMLAMLR